MTIVFTTMAATFAIIVAVLFLRSWHASRDRFFLLFAGAFGLLAIHWLILASIRVSEHSPFHYVLRVAGFALMLAALLDKNRR